LRELRAQAGGPPGATARRHRNVIDPKPMGASSDAGWKRLVLATDSPAEQSPEVEAGARRRGDTATRSKANGERERQVGERGTLREEVEAVTSWSGCRRGKSFEGSSPTGKTRHSDLRVADGLGRPGVGNVANPRAGCGVQQTRTLSRVRPSGRASAEQTVEAGRNGKNGTSTARGSAGPKSWRRPGREWTQGQPCR
jgi:hypothetical protein